MFFLLQLLKLEILIGSIRHLNKEEKDVSIKNVTKDYGVLVLSRTKLEKSIVSINFSNLHNNDFPWLKGKEILINKIPVKHLE